MPSFQEEVAINLAALNRQQSKIISQGPISNHDKVNRWGNIVGSFQALPGLVGFWPLSSVDRSSGDAYDLSGQGRTLTYNGNPTYNLYNNYIPYIDLDGTGDYLSRADETDLDILGSETIYATAMRGLTMGGWFWLDTWTASTFYSPMGKRSYTAGNYSYAFQSNGANPNLFRFWISGDGTNLVAVNGSAITTGQWYFLVGRYDPSTEVALFMNNTKTTNTTSVSAALFNGTGLFFVGAIPTTPNEAIDGRSCLNFLCANALPDTLINSLFNQTRVLFNV